MRVVALISLTVVLASSAWARDGSKTVLDYRLPKASSTTAWSLATPNPLQATTASGKVALAWSNIANETGYIVERRRYGTTNFIELAKTPADRTAYTDVLVSASEHFDYRVRAYKADGRMTYSQFTNIAHSSADCE
jgi:hypothetical protein